MTPPVAFAGSPLDRADQVRADPERLAGLMNWKARLLRLDGLLPAIADDGGLLWGTLADAAPEVELVFLGLDDGKACFAAVPLEGDNLPAYAIRDIWNLLGALSPPDLATYGGARSLVDWHARHRFCAKCGQPTALAKGGWQRNCGSCGAQHFPRTDPVTIMLVEHDGKLMLGRGLGWPEGRYSALAGFVEPGETIEEAVAREVLEETGVIAHSVRYVASQPWPFPSQLMMGCHAMADGEDIQLDTTELSEARWFTRDEVAHAMAGGADPAFLPPPPTAIAHTLLAWWLAQ
ncbi:NAD(+) diphosphatase [Tsuneonella mangrovi]|uniref:NAD(+) diphosphatase n=1 Tax=Tsuneonella mangrovi TaxID=1982042 RepID=UPI001F0B1A5E|nr:NAD(+) diphosphatase [Tsuneonella mangrovi]